MAIEFAPDEESWPDLVVETEGQKFGLEVSEVFRDDMGGRGSTTKEGEVYRGEKLNDMRKEYYKNCFIPISLRIVGNFCPSAILEILLCEAENLIESETKMVDIPGRGSSREARLFITRNRTQNNEDSDWEYINDSVGCVKYLRAEDLEPIIRKKNIKLSKYSSNIQDVRLLLFVNALNHSGQVNIENGLEIEAHHFSEIYFMSDQEVTLLRSKGS